ncbi:MAG: PIN domain-containing protein [Acidobacteriota bacterium]
MAELDREHGPVPPQSLEWAARIVDRWQAGRRAAGKLMLLLDSEALSALARGPTARRDKVRALVIQIRRREETIASVAAVLAEVVRGRSADAAIFAGLRREGVHVLPVDARVGARAGQLLGRAGVGSELAVDAFTVAVADLEGGAVIATADLDDMTRLASHASNVEVADIR